LLDQQLFEHGRRQRLAEQKSLNYVATKRTQILELLLRLNTLGNYRQIERMAQRDDRTHNRRVVWIFANVSHKRLVDFQRIDWKALEIVQR
jgi:hypothetical protein